MKFRTSLPGLAAVLVMSVSSVALAQDADHSWATPGGAIVNGAVGLCVNGSNKAVPCAGGNGGAVTAASGAFVDGSIVTLGTISDAAWSGSGSGTDTAILKAIYAAAINPLAAGTNAIGSITNTAFGVSGTLPAFAATPAFNLASTTSGGASPAGEIAPNNTTGVLVSAGAHTVYAAQMGNISSAPVYLKIYDKVTAPTCGTDTPVKRLIIPAASTSANGGGSNVEFGAPGFAVTTGLGYCVTTGIADNDTTAPTAANVLVNLDYK